MDKPVPYLYLVTSSDGTIEPTVADTAQKTLRAADEAGAEIDEQLDGGYIAVSSDEEQTTYEMIVAYPGPAEQYREMRSEDGVLWQEGEEVPTAEMCKRAFAVRGDDGDIWVLASGTVAVTIDGRPVRRYQPSRSAA